LHAMQRARGAMTPVLTLSTSQRLSQTNISLRGFINDHMVCDRL
jgi:hypothetical protein